MPIYEYRCSECGFEKEYLQKLSDTPISLCERCGQPAMTKLISAAGFQLKGGGWYATDFKNPKPKGTEDAKANGKDDNKVNAKDDSKSNGKDDSKSSGKDDSKSSAVASDSAASGEGKSGAESGAGASAAS